MEYTLVLTKEVKHSDEGDFLEVPFDVPMNTEKLRVVVSIAAGSNEPYTIDVGLCDPAQVRGWSGSTKYDLVIGLDSATPGYLKGPIQQGRWAVLLGAYVVGDAGVSVTAEVTLYPTNKQWLQGDLHVHTVHSDGAYSMAELDEIAQRIGLDFIGLTDHNTVSQNYAYPRETRVTYIPGMELTTYHGHANLFGVKNPCDDFRVQSVSDVQRIMVQARERGARIAINHPFDDTGPSCQWQWGYDVPFEWFEVWNGPWRDANEQSLALWQAMLSEGKRVVAVGGSDTHREHPFVRHGYPTNYVYAKSRNPEDVLEAIGLGQVTLTFCPNGPRLELQASDAPMGGSSQSKRFSVSLTRALPGDEVVLFTGAGEWTRYTVQEPGNFLVEGTHDAEVFLRAEVRRYFPQVDRNLVAAISNPIFVASR